MKLRSTLAFGLFFFTGLLALPTVSGWIVRDFLQQTMQIDGDFEGVSIDPFKGKLVLQNLALDELCEDSSAIARPINVAGKVWANFSLSQLLYRRFDSSLIVIDGLEIGHCDKSLMMLPNFKKKLDENLEVEPQKGLLLGLADFDSGVIDDPVFKASLKNALDQARTRSVISKQHVQAEFDRLQRDANSLAVKPLDSENPLRSELEVKRHLAELNRIAAALNSLSATLNRDFARVTDVGSASQDKILVDWMNWNNTQLAEVESLDVEKHVQEMLSAYATELIKPIIAPLATTHAISRWSMGESNEVLAGASKADQRKLFDLVINPENVSPFAFRNAKLRGRTLIGSEPLAINGTVKRSSSSKSGSASSPSNQSTNIELTFNEATTSQSLPILVSSSPFVATAKYVPANRMQQIELKHHDIRMVNQVELPLGLSAQGIRSKIRLVTPKSELKWSLDGDRWECTFKSYSSDIQIDLVSVEQTERFAIGNAPPNKSELNAKEELPFKLYRSKAHSTESGLPFVQVTYSGRLEGERFDNCNETLECPHIATIAQSIKEYLRQKTETDLVALKDYWLRHSAEQIAAWQKTQESEFANVRQNLQNFEKTIVTQQTRLAEIVSDPSDVRFTRKNSQDKSGTITR